MKQQLDWAAGRPGEEDALLSAESDSQAYRGQLRNAREWTRRAVDAAVRAAGEFRKFLDHRGIVSQFPLGAVAHLQLVRAKVMNGDRNSAKAEYETFLATWKDADADIPTLKQAKAEYAKLRPERG